ncbi:Ig-like domain-containing protein [bacterium]|nr:Ig-like domain-containing protein [bacterium]MBU1752466.1 Ig-like domain-containing protein [bacterium]
MLNKITHYAMLTATFVCLSTTAHALEMRKQPAGDAGDKNPVTFKFSRINIDTQLIKKNGLPISQQDVNSLYDTNGSSTSGDGMRIYDNGIDVCSLEYANLGNRKKPVGIDLSDAAGWPNITINSGEVGIDPILGRFKFFEGKAGTVTVAGRYFGTGESYCGVYVNGNYAYLGEGGSGFYVLDVSNPQFPKKIGKYNIGGIINGLAGDGKYIYLINYQSDFGATSVRIVDVSNPAAPISIGNFGISSRVYDISVVGKYAFVAHINGLTVVDVSDPKKPFERGKYEQTSRGTVYGVCVQGNYAYLAHASIGLKIFDVSDPNSLKEVGECRLTSYKVGSQPYSVYVSGNYAYLSYGAGGLQIIDISNPSSPTLVVKYDTGINDESFYKTHVLGNYAFVISYKKDPKLFNIYCLRVLDISNPKEPKLIQQYIENIGKPIFDSYDISILKGQAYVTDASNAMRILEIPMSSELPAGSVTVDYNFAVEPLNIVLTSPDGGEVLSGKASNNITCNITGGVPPHKVVLYYSTDSGKIFDNTIATSIPMYTPTLSYPWTVPGTNTLNLRVKAVVVDATGAASNDISNGDIQVDFTAPLVTGTNISDGAKDIATNTTMVINFSKPMNQSATQQAFSIFPDISNKTFVWSEDKKQLTINSDGFSGNATYTCTLSTEARDSSSPGNRLSSAYCFSFKTVVPPPGSVSVTVNVKNASVFLDNILVGTGGSSSGSSLIIGNVIVGSHTLSVTKTNYSTWQGVVLIQSQQTANVYATLTPTIQTVLLLAAPEEVGVNETFTVTIRVEKVTKLTNMDIFISFDPELLDVLEIKDNAFIPKIVSKIGSSSISYGAGVMSGNITGNGTIAEVIFMAKKKGNVVLSFDFNQNANRNTTLVSGVKNIPFIDLDSKNISIVEFGCVDGHVAIDIPRLGTYSGICVDVPTTGIRTTTNAEGYFLLKRIPPGRVDIRANGSGLTPNMWKGIEIIGQQQVTTPGTLTLINGDADGDGMVNTMDFGRLRDAYFKTKTDAGWIDTGTLTRNGYINVDLNGDDKVNAEDFAILRDNYFKAAGETRAGNKQLAPMLIAASNNNAASSNNNSNTVAAGLAPTCVSAGLATARVSAGLAPTCVSAGLAPARISAGLATACVAAGLAPTCVSAGLAPARVSAGLAPACVAAGLAPAREDVAATMLVPTQSASTAHLIIDLPQDMDKIKVKAEFPVNIRVENVSSLTSMDFSLKFDPTILSVNRTQGDAFLPKITSNISNSVGIVSHAAGLMSGSANGNGTIATVYFVLNKKKNTKLEFLQDAKKNRQTTLISTSRKVIPFTSEQAILLFEGGTSGQGTKSTATSTASRGDAENTEEDQTATQVLIGSMTLVAAFKPDGMSYGIFLKGNYAYMSCESGGMQIIDVSNPLSPVLAGKYNMIATCRDTCVVGNYAFAASGVGGLIILDVSNAAKPVLVSSMAINGFCHDVAVSGNYAYIAAAQAGLQIIDISKPHTPKKIGKYRTNGIARGVCIRDGYAFVADGSNGLQIIDISNPYGPKLTGSCATPRDAYDIWLTEEAPLTGKYAYIADYSGGLQIIDVSNQAKPCIVGSYKTNGYAWDVAVRDNLAFVVCAAAGLYIINVTDPAHPALAGKLDTGGKAFGVSVQDGYILVADDYQGLKVIKAEGISVGADLRVCPDKQNTGVGTQNTGVRSQESEHGTQTTVDAAQIAVAAGLVPATGSQDKQGTGSRTQTTDDAAQITVAAGLVPATDSEDKQDTERRTQTSDTDISPIDNYVPGVLVDTYSLSLSASANNQTGSIRLGMNPWSTDGFDEWTDTPLPPPPSIDKYLQVYFPHPEWGLVFDKFNADIRSMDDNHPQKEWVFEVQTNMPAGTKISLSMGIAPLANAASSAIDASGYTVGADLRVCPVVGAGSKPALSDAGVIGQDSWIVQEINQTPILASLGEIILTDEETGQAWNINKEGTVTFSVDNDGLKRFKLSIKLPVTGKKFTSGWHMVSLPIAASWLPVEGYVYEYTSGGYSNIIESIESGRGYWLGMNKETTVNLRADKETRAEVAIPLNAGWNMIGCPFAFTPDWSSVCIEKDGVRKGLKAAIEANLVNGILYKYVDDNYQVSDGIEPWEGYWFAALTDCNLIIPNSSSSFQLENNKAETKADTIASSALLKLSPAKAAASPDKWQISLHVSAGKYQDTANGAPCLGVNPDSSIGLDKSDRLELPEPQGNFVTLRFVHPDEPTNNGVSPFDQFDWDVRPPSESIVWEFEVKSNLSGERIAITWDKEEIPQDYCLMLIDKDTLTSMVMDKENGYTYICGSNNGLAARHFMVRAIKADPLQAQNEEMSNFSGLKIWPNPATKPYMNFDGFTGKATIRIFTLNGELIKNMPDVDAAASWDLKNNDSQPVASGVYLFIINNAASKRCGKLAVIK